MQRLLRRGASILLIIVTQPFFPAPAWGQQWVGSAHPRLRGRDRGVRELFTSRRVSRARTVWPFGPLLQDRIASGIADSTTTWRSGVPWPKQIASTQKRDLLSPSYPRTGGCPRASLTSLSRLNVRAVGGTAAMRLAASSSPRLPRQLSENERLVLASFRTKVSGRRPRLGPN